MDYQFTAGMEEKLDKIAEKQAIWNVVLEDFYKPFIENVNSVMKTAQKVNIETKIKCPNCGKPMLLRTSKTGSQFLGCSGYPDCKTTMSLNVMQEMEEEQSGEVADKPKEVCEEKCENVVLIWYSNLDHMANIWNAQIQSVNIVNLIENQLV